MLRAAEAEAQAEAARALIGADMGPDVNSATSPVHGARNHKGCTEVAKRKAPDLFVQVRDSETLDINYSHSFTHVCCGVIPVGSSLVVGLRHLSAESRGVTSRRRLGQILGQNRKLFRNREPAASFLFRGQKRVGFEARNSPKWMPKRVVFLFGTCLAK